MINIFSNIFDFINFYKNIIYIFLYLFYIKYIFYYFNKNKTTLKIVNNFKKEI